MITLSTSTPILEAALVSLVLGVTFFGFWAFGGRSRPVLAWSFSHTAWAAGLFLLVGRADMADDWHLIVPAKGLLFTSFALAWVGAAWHCGHRAPVLRIAMIGALLAAALIHATQVTPDVSAVLAATRLALGALALGTVATLCLPLGERGRTPERLAALALVPNLLLLAVTMAITLANWSPTTEFLDHPGIALSITGGVVGNLIWGLGFLLLVTHRASQRHKEAGQRYRHLVEQSLVGLYRMTGDRIAYANPTLCAALGYELEELQQTRHPVDLMAPEDRDAFSAQLADCLEGRVDNLRQTVTALTRDGRALRLEVQARRLDRATGPELFGIALDVSEAEAAARLRATAQAELEQRVIDRTRDLMAAKDAAEAASRAKSEFLANMSHELRTPLNAVIGFSSMIEMAAWGPVGDARYVDYARDSRTSAEHLLSIINDILDVSAVEAGSLRLHTEASSPRAAAETTLRLIEPRATAAGVAVTLDAAASLPDRMNLDERRFKQILINLLSNAVKFTPAGGRVTLAAEGLADGGARFTVADTGIGMSEAEIATALQPFGQVDSSLSRKWDGTGLGLPLTQGLVALHGGAMRLESTPGRGTSVIVDLPATTPAPAPDDHVMAAE
jgi:PAS domain S-box-containing protein